MSNSQNSKEQSAIDPSAAFIADYQGIFQQHTNMWNVYNSSLKVLLAVISLPLLIGGLLLRNSSNHDIDVLNMPLILTASVFVTPILSLLTVGAVAHYRSDILFYARSLNRYRSIYLKLFDDRIDVSPMPTDPIIPPAWEPLGPMGMIATATGFVSGLYVIAAVTSYCSAFPKWYWGLLIVIVNIVILQGVCRVVSSRHSNRLRSND